MDRATRIVLQIGSWRVDPTSGCISMAGESVRLDGRTMKLLLYLADHAGEVVSVEELLDQVWIGVIVTQDSVYQAVASLRRLLGDDAKRPAYIATVPRLGYKLLATVSPWVEEPTAIEAVATDSPKVLPVSGFDEVAVPTEAVSSRRENASSAPGAPLVPIQIEAKPAAGGRKRVLFACVGMLCMALVIAIAWRVIGFQAATTAPARSVAVLPFLDLTSQEMGEEYFADGVTEELIDRLSKLPGMRVPSPASSFRFKDKDVPVADFARSLGVSYVVSGSIRKSAKTQRITARLVRASDGYILWSQDYDQPIDNELKVQDDIAGRVATALNASIR